MDKHARSDKTIRATAKALLDLAAVLIDDLKVETRTVKRQVTQNFTILDAYAGDRFEVAKRFRDGKVLLSKGGRTYGPLYLAQPGQERVETTEDRRESTR